MSHVIEAADVTVTIDGVSVLNGATIACAPGTVTALVGPSGSGKTTLLHCLGLLQTPTSGAVRIDSVDTTGWGAATRRRFWRDSASFILQDYGVMDDESVGFNVTMTMTMLGRRTGGDLGRLQAALAAAGLQGREQEPASHLSGGEKQRLGIARSVYKEASCLFVDEPTASLDRANRERVMGLFRDRADAGCTVIIATHDDLVIDASDSRLTLPNSAQVEAVAS